MADQRVKIILVVIAVFAMTGTSGKQISTFAGPYRVIIRRATNISNQYSATGDIWIKVLTKWPKLKQLQYVAVTTYNSIPFDDNLQAEMHMTKWANNQYKRDAASMTFINACSDALTHATPMVETYFGEDGKKCPIEPGFRQLKNHSIDWAFPHIPVFPYGRYKSTLLLRKQGTIVGITITEMDIVPRL